tara:strand:- start:6 stop:668 length:663 start_codon:yes stop_codon:yes gene_type:complete
MKGTLYKTENGWVVKYYIMRESSHAIHPNERNIPLHPHDSASIFIKDTDHLFEGKTIHFKIEECWPIGAEKKDYAIVDETAYLTEANSWPEYPTKSQQLQIKIAEECFKRYPNNELLYPTDDLKDAYKAGVIDGLKEWKLDSYDRPKYPEVKIICPRCKDIMPCECNAPKQNSLLNSIRSNSSWNSILKEFISANSQTKPLTFECWLVENYNPPTKKQDK